MKESVKKKRGGKRMHKKEIARKTQTNTFFEFFPLQKKKQKK